MTDRASPRRTDNDPILKEVDAPSAPAPARKKRKKKRSIGSRRGVETVFRNAYRAHLDLIALAATKANIMISINGLILSFLFLSEAFSVSSDPLLDIPTGVFLVTCFVSMAFAIMSALPDRRTGEWRPEDFKAHRANLLVFEDYTALTEDEYVPAMREALRDGDRLYDSMIRQLYFLGTHANKRLRMLRLSYRVFLIGLGLSILTSFVVLLMIYGAEDPATAATGVPGSGEPTAPVFGRYLAAPGLVEPSGAVQLPDGRLLVVGDEAPHALSILDFDRDGRPRVTALAGGSRLADLEAATADGAGRVYAVTSHTAGRGGDAGDFARERLVRFRMEDERVVEEAVLSGLKPRLQAALPARGDPTATGADLNIEGLTVDRSGERLWLGLRSPLVHGRAVIAVLENPTDAFAGSTPRLSTMYLDLDGGGVRGLTYDPRLDAYLILARPEHGVGAPFRLWHWTGRLPDPALPVDIDGVPDLRRAEGIAPVGVAGRDGIVILSDEGADRGPGRYLLLRYEQLSTADGPLLPTAGQRGRAQFRGSEIMEG